MTDLEIGSRYETALEEAGIVSADDFLNALAEGGDAAITNIKGIGAKTLIDIKRALRSRGFEVPEA